MSFLKKFGQVLLKVTQILTGFGPILSQTVPQSAPVVDKLDQIVNIVMTIEGAAAGAVSAGATLTGAQKLAAAAPFTAQIVRGIEALTGKNPKDEAKFEAAVNTITSGVADLLNSFGD